MKHIENDMISLRYADTSYKNNRFLVSGLFHIEKYYRQPHLQHYYSAYVSNVPTVSIGPNIWIME
jgi:hypothetical protein